MAVPLSASDELQLVRDRLGIALGEDAAAAAFMAALEIHGGRLPRDASQVESFVDGPLRESVTQLLDATTAERVVHRLLSGSRASVLPDVESSGTHKRRAASMLEETTVGAQTGPVRLVIVARSPRLAERIRLSVGADDVAVGVATDPHQGGLLAHEVNASMVIIDGTDVPQGGADDYVDGLGSLPGNTLLLLWTEGGPEAERLQTGLEFCSLRVTVMDRREGVHPLIDIIRSRRSTR